MIEQKKNTMNKALVIFISKKSHMPVVKKMLIDCGFEKPKKIINNRAYPQAQSIMVMSDRQHYITLGGMSTIEASMASGNEPIEGERYRTEMLFSGDIIKNPTLLNGIILEHFISQ